MRKGELIDKGAAAALTVAFMALVRPDPEPTRVGLTVTAVLMYEALRWCIWFVRKMHRRQKEKHYITVTKRDMERWAKEWLYWPMKEVS